MTIQNSGGKIIFVAETADAKQNMPDSPGGIMEGVEGKCKVERQKNNFENNLKKVVDKWLMNVIEYTSCRLRVVERNHRERNRKIKKLLTNDKRCDNLIKMSLETATKNIDN